MKLERCLWYFRPRRPSPSDLSYVCQIIRADCKAYIKHTSRRWLISSSVQKALSGPLFSGGQAVVREEKGIMTFPASSLSARPGAKAWRRFSISVRFGSSLGASSGWKASRPAWKLLLRSREERNRSEGIEPAERERWMRTVEVEPCFSFLWWQLWLRLFHCSDLSEQP